LECLIYDSNEKIIGAEELFKGSTDASIVDLKIMARSLLNYQDVKGFAVFHNHPSGNPTPSRKI
jgi:DNA repair protein RadC